MTLASEAKVSRNTARPSPRLTLWAAALLAFFLFWQFGEPFAAWAFDYPRAWQVPAARLIGNAAKWLVNEASFGLFTFTEMTRFVAAVAEVPYTIALSLLSTGFLSGQGS